MGGCRRRSGTDGVAGRSGPGSRWSARRTRAVKVIGVIGGEGAELEILRALAETCGLALHPLVPGDSRTCEGYIVLDHSSAPQGRSTLRISTSDAVVPA